MRGMRRNFRHRAEMNPQGLDWNGAEALAHRGRMRKKSQPVGWLSADGGSAQSVVGK
jgi:hypothetical protein